MQQEQVLQLVVVAVEAAVRWIQRRLAADEGLAPSFDRTFFKKQNIVIILM